MCCRKNTNCDIKESIRRLKEVTEAATQSNLRVRGYISTVIACPYQGKIAPKVVANIAEQLLQFGCYEGTNEAGHVQSQHLHLVSLGDTIGAGSAGSVNALLDEVLKAAPVEKLAVHFHDSNQCYYPILSNKYL